MITHFMVGTNDLPKARAFYDAVLGTVGYAPADPADKRATYKLAGSPSFMVGKPFDGGAASAANGGTIGFGVAATADVDAFHAAGLAQGGRCEGAPGMRGEVNVYAAYLRDPDGNKLGAFALGEHARRG